MPNVDGPRRKANHTVVAGDSLTALSARFGVPLATLARLNGLRSTAALRQGDSLVVDNRHIAVLLRTLTLRTQESGDTVRKTAPSSTSISLPAGSTLRDGPRSLCWSMT